jgi:outer membrane protein assembly factor BamA
MVSSPVRIAVFTTLCAFLSGPAAQAQSQQREPPKCSPPCVSTDEFREMVGKKVYPKMIVDSVKFDTSAHLPDSGEEPEIISEIKQHAFDYGQEGLDEVLEVQIRSAWQDQGFFKVLASSQTQVVSSASAYEHVVVTIHVDPGQQYRLGVVRFRSSDPDDRETLAFPREDLRKLLPLREGDIFNVAKIRESLDAMKKLYDSRGYLNFVATPDTAADDATQRISLVMELDEGKQFRVGKVEVFGLEPSKAAALTSRVKPGDVFQYSHVEAFVKANIPTFLDVTSSEVLDLRKRQRDGIVDIVVNFRRLPKQE